MRNTKVIDIYNALQTYNLNITVYDPWANPEIVKREYGIDVVNSLPAEKYDAVILAVSHQIFTDMDVVSLAKQESIIYDVKGFLKPEMVDGRL